MRNAEKFLRLFSAIRRSQDYQTLQNFVVLVHAGFPADILEGHFPRKKMGELFFGICQKLNAQIRLMRTSQQKMNFVRLINWHLPVVRIFMRAKQP